jgi:protein-tyrosine phosphatase
MKARSVNLQELLMRRVDTESSGDGSLVWDAALVRPGLYVGSLRSALDIDNLAAHNITSVLTVAGQLVVELPTSVEHMQISIPDHPVADILEILPQAIPFLDKILLDPHRGERSILVHCASGISRSVSVCCAWLMFREGQTFSAALEQIRVVRPWAKPNAGFSSQLTVLSDFVNEAERGPGDGIESVVTAAREEYTRKLGGRTLMDNLLTQRTVANELHAAVDGTYNADNARTIFSAMMRRRCPALIPFSFHTLQKLRTR